MTIKSFFKNLYNIFFEYPNGQTDQKPAKGSCKDSIETNKPAKARPKKRPQTRKVRKKAS